MASENTIFKVKDELFSRKHINNNFVSIIAMDLNEKIFPLKVFRNDIFLLLDIKFNETQNKTKTMFYKCLHNGIKVFIMASLLCEVE